MTVKTSTHTELFEELALLQDTPRTATVRCLTPVNVMCVNRQDFQQLIGSYQLFKTHMENEIAVLKERETSSNGGQKTPLPHNF